MSKLSICHAGLLESFLSVKLAICQSHLFVMLATCHSYMSKQLAHLVPVLRKFLVKLPLISLCGCCSTKASVDWQRLSMCHEQDKIYSDAEGFAATLAIWEAGTDSKGRHICWKNGWLSLGNNIFAYCGLVGNPHLTAKIYFLLPFQRQPRNVCSLSYQTSKDR